MSESKDSNNSNDSNAEHSVDTSKENTDVQEAHLSPRTVATIENPDLQRMRRLCIILSLILITYAAAAVKLDVGQTISPLGIPLTINNPELLGIGLVAATVYALLRFILYGLVKNLSPRRFRKVLMEERSGNSFSDYKYKLFQGESRTDIIRELNEAFPSLGSKGVGIVEPETDQDRLFVEYSLPKYSHELAMVHDIDYLAPIWFSVFAIAMWLAGFIGYLN